jgi:hypothetical protein
MKKIFLFVLCCVLFSITAFGYYNYLQVTILFSVHFSDKASGSNHTSYAGEDGFGVLVIPMDKYVYAYYICGSDNNPSRSTYKSYLKNYKTLIHDNDYSYLMSIANYTGKTETLTPNTMNVKTMTVLSNSEIYSGDETIYLRDKSGSLFLCTPKINGYSFSNFISKGYTFLNHYFDFDDKFIDEIRENAYILKSNMGY